MSVNPWQQAGIQINAWDAAPVEYLAPLRTAGYTRVELLLNALRKDPPLPPPTRFYCDSLKRAGFNVYGVVWADYFPHDPSTFNDPFVCAEFAIAEKKRLNLNSIIVNAEDWVEGQDAAGLGWSDDFTYRFREALPKLPLALNTYIGCGGIALSWWEQANARLIVQTHHEGHTFEWGVPGYVAWAKKYGWKNAAAIKPQFAVYKGADGQRASIEAQVASAKAAGTIGFSAYYGEGCFDEPQHMVSLLAQARARGVCR
jgi:hypothetical protein